jgi:hypothetical protein
MRKFEDITNKKFGKLTVTGFNRKDKTYYFWNCHCDCGNDIIVSKNNLKSRTTSSCGCISRQLGKHSLRFSGYEEIPGSYIGKKKFDSKKRHIRYAVSKKHLWELFLKQNRKCALSGRDIKFQTCQGDYSATASLDRIDSSKGYVKGNIQWLHKDVNRMKQEFEEKYFIGLCKDVVDHNTHDHTIL